MQRIALNGMQWTESESVTDLCTKIDGYPIQEGSGDVRKRYLILLPRVFIPL